MTLRLSLSAKIALWFGLNVLALAAVFALLFNAQFNLTLDWLLETGAGERLEAVRNLIVGELDTTPPAEWTRVLARTAKPMGSSLRFSTTKPARSLAASRVCRRRCAPESSPGCQAPTARDLQRIPREMLLKARAEPAAFGRGHQFVR